MATYYSKVMFVSVLSLIRLAGAELQSPCAATAVRLGKYLSESVGSPVSSFGGDLVCFVALGHPQTRASITLIGIPGWAPLINTSFIFVGKALAASNPTRA